LYPQHIIEVLNSYGKIKTFVIQASLDDLGNDKVTVIVPDTFAEIEELADIFRSRLNVAPEIQNLAEEKISKLKFPKRSRKPQIFRDLR
ncbi:MAG TPA: hypothetical protein VJ973_08015, partial [Christiangramia sp.]|nr:hypothetical protein [Christiangramia sp.]